ncbi:MAG TPA: DMT family transporter [Aquella sp.]|nr:DMT family transporter [Aquella sp.]
MSHTNKTLIAQTKPDYLKIINAYSLLFVLGLTWGIQFLFAGIALKTLPAMTTATLRTIIGALTVCILSLLLYKPQKRTVSVTQKMHIWHKYIIISIFDAVVPFYLMNWGQQYVNSSIASIVVSTAPIFVLFLSGLFLPGKHWTLSMAISVIVGFLGVVVLVLPNASTGSSILGELSLLGASLSFAIAMILLKTLPSENQLKSIRNILISASVIMIIPACIIDKPWILTYNFSAIFSVCVLGVVCSGLSYLIYIKLIHLVNPTFAALSSYLIPIVGVLLGVTYGKETISTHELVALIIVFASLIASQIPQGKYKKSQNKSNE